MTEILKPRLELTWFQGFCEDGEDVAAISHAELVWILSDMAAILGLGEDLPPQPAGTTFDMLAQKILDQASAKRVSKR